MYVNECYMVVLAGSVGVCVRDVRDVSGRAAGHPGREQRDAGRARAEGLARHHQVLRQLHEEPALPQVRLHVFTRTRSVCYFLSSYKSINK